MSQACNLVGHMFSCACSRFIVKWNEDTDGQFVRQIRKLHSIVLGEEKKEGFLGRRKTQVRFLKIPPKHMEKRVNSKFFPLEQHKTIR